MVGLVEGKVAVVAGGGRGIGEATARRLAEHGARVVVVDKVPERAERVASELVAAGAEAVAAVLNLRDDDAGARVIAAAETFGGIDILVNVAGGMRPETAWRPLREMEPSDWDFVFRQNVRWVYLVSIAVAEAMRASGGGSVVGIGSVSGVFGAPNHAAYGAAKAGLIHLTKSLALEYGRYGVRFNSVSPGSIRTPAVKGLLTPEQEARDDETTALGRAGTPDDIAKTVVFLASDLAGFVTGQMLIVDGGATVRFPLPSPGAHPSESLV